MSDSKGAEALVTGLRQGDPAAIEKLIRVTYKELRRLAGHYMKSERPEHTLQPTALVHEVYLRIFANQPLEWNDQQHFFAVAAKQMRRVLLDYARASNAERRGGDFQRLSMQDIETLPAKPSTHLLVLDEALEKLNEVDPRASQVVELRYFGGLTESEAASVLGISVATLKRDWEFGKAFIARQMG
ncbi:MAG: sigma-70 family RNA polymerase sigma factor [Acidobacteria bacterium]|nr:sigma-70 family RNA polymerase sigma factor [Acidobacteriota bacterium]MCI0626921.1 sigma-70 family RNA polymerase sigma factor [Acidobacteriota bacterium]MCI0723223.1 sigma-70 family RNA polymerase sigma factor [Acidobacteriota bacterium]